MPFWKRAVFQIVGFLAGLALVLQIVFIGWVWHNASQRSVEATLHDDLATMRDAIQQYTLDKQAAPQSLEDLVLSGYLRKVPSDPITNRTDWSVEKPERGSSGVTDVHCPSNAISPFENTPYNTW